MQVKETANALPLPLASVPSGWPDYVHRLSDLYFLPGFAHSAGLTHENMQAQQNHYFQLKVANWPTKQSIPGVATIASYTHRLAWCLKLASFKLARWPPRH